MVPGGLPSLYLAFISQAFKVGVQQGHLQEKVLVLAGPPPLHRLCLFSTGTEGGWWAFSFSLGKRVVRVLHLLLWLDNSFFILEMFSFIYASL